MAYLGWGGVCGEWLIHLAYQDRKADLLLLKSGDYLIVVPGEDSLKERELNHHSDAAQSANKYAARYW